MKVQGLLERKGDPACSGLNEGFLDEAVEIEKEVTPGSVFEKSAGAWTDAGGMDMAAQDDFWVSDQNACKSKALLPDRAVGRGVGFAGGTAEHKQVERTDGGTGSATKWEGRRTEGEQGEDGG